MLIEANTQPGVFKRTMIRTDLNRLLLPSSFLCPSGYTRGDGLIPCEPAPTPTVVILFFSSASTCTPELIASTRQAILAFLSSP